MNFRKFLILNYKFWIVIVDLFTFIIIAVVYIMVMHFAIGINNDFNLFLMIGIFVLAGALGMYLHTYEFALAAGFILTLIFWWFLDK